MAHTEAQRRGWDSLRRGPGSPLSDRQRRVLDFIVGYQRTHQRSPTIREIGQALDIHSTNGVNDHLRRLVAKGAIEMPKGDDGQSIARSIRVIGAPSAEPERDAAALAAIALARAVAGCDARAGGRVLFTSEVYALLDAFIAADGARS